MWDVACVIYHFCFIFCLFASVFGTLCPPGWFWPVLNIRLVDFFHPFPLPFTTVLSHSSILIVLSILCDQYVWFYWILHDSPLLSCLPARRLPDFHCRQRLTVCRRVRDIPSPHIQSLGRSLGHIRSDHSHNTNTDTHTHRWCCQRTNHPHITQKKHAPRTLAELWIDAPERPNNKG